MWYVEVFESFRSCINILKFLKNFLQKIVLLSKLQKKKLKVGLKFEFGNFIYMLQFEKVWSMISWIEHMKSILLSYQEICFGHHILVYEKVIFEMFHIVIIQKFLFQKKRVSR